MLDIKTRLWSSLINHQAEFELLVNFNISKSKIGAIRFERTNPKCRIA